MVQILYYFSNSFNESKKDLLQAKKEFTNLQEYFYQLIESHESLENGIANAEKTLKVISTVPINSASMI